MRKKSFSNKPWPTKISEFIKRCQKLINKNEDGCLIWKGNVVKQGYGKVFINNKRLTVTRILMAIMLGRPLDKKEEVCHTCDNPSCINIKHLFIGSHKENMYDCFSKGRHKYKVYKGEKHGASKLTEKEVREIMKKIELGETQKSIAKDYGVDASCISNIKRKRNWGHLWEVCDL